MIVTPGKLKHRTFKDDAPLRPVDLPTIAAATAPLLAPTTIVIDFNIGGTPPILPASGVTGFSVTSGGSGKTISSAARTGEKQITLTMALPIVHLATTTLDYSSGNVTDTATSALATVVAFPVTNLV